MNVYIFQYKDSPCVRCRKVVNSFIKKKYSVTYVGVNRGEKIISIDGLTIRHIGIKTPRGSLLKIFTLPFFIFSSLIFLLKNVRRNDIVYCADLDSALGVYISSFFKNNFIFIYDVLDTYADRYKNLKLFSSILRNIESRVFGRSDIPIHVDFARAKTLKKTSKNFLVIHNKPSENDLYPLNKSFKNYNTETFKILLSGGIYDHRGAIKISDAIQNLISDRYKIELNVIGSGNKKIIDSLKSKSFVNYYGYVTSSLAQKFSLESELITCLYDPLSPINRLASPNKIFDAVSNGSMALVNNEITNDTVHTENENIVYCNYDDVNSISDAIIESINYLKNETNQIKLLERAKIFRDQNLWEHEFEQVFDILK